MSVITMLPGVSGNRISHVGRFAAVLDTPVRRGTRAPICRSVPVPGVARPIEVKFASNRLEWEEAFQLVADQYQARGYESAGVDCRFTSYHVLPDTVVLVAKSRGRIVATMSLVADNTLLGLPMEGLYKAEMQELRRQGRHLVETGSLADRDLSPREFHQVFLTLMQLGWQYVVGQGADTTVIAINPRHSAFYTRLHGFLPLGPRRAYDRVQGHPAEAFYLDSGLMAARVPEIHSRIFARPLPATALVAPRMPHHLIYYFAAHSSQTRLATVEQILWNVDQGGSPRRW